MMKRRSKRLFLGFSLIELMAAIGIVSVLVSLALPRYRAFIARGRMAEAKTNLGIIATLQQSHYVEYGNWGSIDGMGAGGSCQTGTDGSQAKNELGFRVIECGKLKYHYTSTGGRGNANSKNSEIYPGCTGGGSSDEWSISTTRELNHDHNIISSCAD